MASMSVSGIVSGMDWEGMIDSIIESASSAAYVQVNKKTNLTNKKTLFEEMKVSMQSIQSSLSTLKLPSTYKAKEIDIERIDTNGSYKGVLTATVNADAEVNVHELEVKQLATAQTNRSKQITASTLKNTLGSLTSSKFYINAGGQQVGIDVYATDSLDSLKSRINTTLKSLSTPLAVSASVVDNKLILKSDYTGLGKTTVEGTLKDKYTTTGCTSLATLITNTDAGTTTNIFVSDDYLDELKVTSGSSSYTIHKDYEVVNNEIRWKQYEDTNAVKLGDSVSAVYTMGKDDVIEVTATRGSSDSDSIDFGFDVKDYGTLGNRMKIKSVQTETETEVTEGIAQEPDEDQLASETGVDEDGNEYVITYSYEEVQGDDEDDVTYTLTATKTTYINTYYTYGTDFTYSDGKINWITKDDTTTNEPSSYTVSYTQDNSINYSKTISRGTVTQTSTNEPDFYSTKIVTGFTSSYQAVTPSSSNTYYDNISINFDKLNEAYKKVSGSDLPLYTGQLGSYVQTCIDPSETYRSAFTIESSDGTKYQYGRDFVITTKDASTNTSSGAFQIIWNTGTATGVVGAYRTLKNITDAYLPHPSGGNTLTFSFEHDGTATYSGNVNAGDNDKRLSTIFGTEIDSSNYANLEIRGYTYGTDYKVQEDANGEAEIVWLNKPETLASDDDDFDITDLNTNYKQITGSDLSTVTLTGSDGVIRTYINPDEDYMSALTITSGSDTYEYGRDFVIRVKDDGQGYVVSWLVANDVDGDGDLTAKDANVAVSTYTQYKELSTLEFNQAPSGDYNVNFKYEKLDTTTKTVSSSATDKSLKTILGYELSSDEYEDLVIKNGTKTYEYGYDFTIETDDDGNAYISWIDVTPKKPSEDVTFTINYYTGDTYESDSINTSAASSGRPSDKLVKIKIDDGDYISWNEISDIISADDFDSSIFYVIDSNGTRYEYGTDFTFAETGNSSSVNGDWDPLPIIKWKSTVSASDVGTSYNVYYKSGVNVTSEDLEIEYDDDYSVFDDLFYNLDDDEIPSTFSRDNISITDSNGTTYYYGRDFKINTDGTIKWLESIPTGPDEKSEYTIIYESFDSVTSTADDEDNTIVRISNSGYGNYSDGTGDYLSYEQILSSFGLSTSSAENIIDSSFKKSNLFTLTDDDNTYTYGTDFVIRMSEDYVDGATGEHLTKIKWLDDGKKPSNSATLTLTYGSDGGEKFEMDEAITRSNSDVIVSGVSGTPVYSEFESGTVTINQAGRTYYQGYDFDVGTNDNGETVINWKTGTDYEWYLPNSGQYSRYTVNLVTSDGTEKTYSGVRNYEDVLDMQDFGFTTVSGNLTSVSYGGKTFDLTDTEVDEDGKTDVDYAAEWNGISVNEGTSGGVKAFKFDWVTPALTSREGLPTYGSDVEIEYDYCANTFSLSDEGDGIIDLLGLEDDVTQALNAVIELNGVEIEKDLNDIGADYENEISNLKGVTLHLKGTGKVSLDISHDAEKAVTSIQTYVENYNSLMTWINTRMTESQVDDDTAATIDSDDFRMRWGLLHGNSLLRNAKSSMRDITAKNYTFSFTERKSSSEIYGPMSYNGLRNDSTLRLRIGSVYADLTISPDDTLQDIVDKISDSSNAAMRNIFYGSDGKLLEQPLIKASISGDKLVLNSTNGDEITLSGSAALNALKMNYTYKGVYQLGIATTSTDYGKSGEIEFDEEKFMEALEDNPDETQALMLKYVGEMDTWLKSMLNSSASGETSGTLTRQIQDLESQINNINDYLEDYQDRLDRMEENLRTKYAAAEQNISKLSQQASAMASILQTMTNSSSNNNSSSSSS